MYRKKGRTCINVGNFPQAHSCGAITFSGLSYILAESIQIEENTRNIMMVFHLFAKVGIAACQLADRAGLRVLGTAGSDSGIELLKSIGVKDIFNHKSEDYNKEIMV